MNGRRQRRRGGGQHGRAAAAWARSSFRLPHRLPATLGAVKRRAPRRAVMEPCRAGRPAAGGPSAPAAHFDGLGRRHRALLPCAADWLAKWRSQAPCDRLARLYRLQFEYGHRGAAYSRAPVAVLRSPSHSSLVRPGPALRFLTTASLQRDVTGLAAASKDTGAPQDTRAMVKRLSGLQASLAETAKRS